MSAAPECSEELSRLKSAMHLFSGRAVDQLTRTQHRPRAASKPFVFAANELVFELTQRLALDLEAFSKHAKRRTITVDDVLLTTRRNPQLTRQLQEFAPAATAPKAKRARKSLAPREVAGSTSKGIERESSADIVSDAESGSAIEDRLLDDDDDAFDDR